MGKAQKKRRASKERKKQFKGNGYFLPMFLLLSLLVGSLESSSRVNHKTNTNTKKIQSQWIFSSSLSLGRQQLGK